MGPVFGTAAWEKCARWLSTAENKGRDLRAPASARGHRGGSPLSDFTFSRAAGERRARPRPRPAPEPALVRGAESDKDERSGGGGGSGGLLGALFWASDSQFLGSLPAAFPLLWQP